MSCDVEYCHRTGQTMRMGGRDDTSPTGQIRNSILPPGAFVAGFRAGLPFSLKSKGMPGTVARYVLYSRKFDRILY